MYPLSKTKKERNITILKRGN